MGFNFANFNCQEIIAVINSSDSYMNCDITSEFKNCDFGCGRDLFYGSGKIDGNGETKRIGNPLLEKFD
jgi:hypothetical protein